MGIYARDDVSHKAHKAVRPSVPGQYHYDQFVVEVDGEEWLMTIDWSEARSRYLEELGLSQEEGSITTSVRLIGEVLN